MQKILYKSAQLFLYLTVIAIFASCNTHYRTTVDNSPGRATTYEDPSSVGRVKGIGIESQDIISMTDTMARDMLSNRILSSSVKPPRIIIDSEYFKNESSQRINKNLISDRLRIGLTRAAQGRMVFIARHAIDMVEHERDLKREGIVDSGSKSLTAATAGGDYRLTGRITDINQIDPNSGEKARYYQITFEMVDLNEGIIVWGGIYEFKKSAKDDIIYRD